MTDPILELKKITKSFGGNQILRGIDLQVAAGEFITLLGSSGWGGAFGLLCGILCDAALGGGGLLFTVALTVMGFLCGFLGDFILARGFPSYLMLSAGVLLLSAFIQMFRLLVFDHAPVWLLIRTGLMQSLASALFILPLYFCVRRALRAWRRGRERSAH